MRRGYLGYPDLEDWEEDDFAIAHRGRVEGEQAESAETGKILTGWASGLRGIRFQTKKPISKSGQNLLSKFPEVKTSRADLNNKRVIGIMYSVGQVGDKGKFMRGGVLNTLKRRGQTSGFVTKDAVVKHQVYIERPEALIEKEGATFGTIAETLRERKEFWHEGYAWVEARARGKQAVQHRIIVELPHELSLTQMQSLVRDYCTAVFLDVPWHVALHKPPEGGDKRNWHAHVVIFPNVRVAERKHEFGIRGEIFRNRFFLQELRKQWQEHCNLALERAGKVARVYTSRHVDVGINRKPGEHLGRLFTKLERIGMLTTVGARNWDKEKDYRKQVMSDHLDSVKGLRRFLPQEVGPRVSDAEDKYCGAILRDEVVSDKNLVIARRRRLVASGLVELPEQIKESELELIKPKGISAKKAYANLAKSYEDEIQRVCGLPTRQQLLDQLQVKKVKVEKQIVIARRGIELERPNGLAVLEWIIRIQDKSRRDKLLRQLIKRWSRAGSGVGNTKRIQRMIKAQQESEAVLVQVALVEGGGARYVSWASSDDKRGLSSKGVEIKRELAVISESLGYGAKGKQVRKLTKIKTRNEGVER